MMDCQEMRAAMALLIARNRRDMDVHVSRDGHWHARNVSCLESCPMSGHGRTSVLTAQTLAIAAGFPDSDPFTGRKAGTSRETEGER